MLLKNFYLATVNKNETFNGGWAPLYYGIVSKIINDNSYNSYCEVGIGYGFHAKYILDKMNEISLSGREPDLKDDEIIRKDWSKIENVEFGKIKNQLEPIVKLWHNIVTSGMQNGNNIRSSKMITM